MRYVHPELSETEVRVMPGKPHSSNPCQQKPYVVYEKEGKIINKLGNIVDEESVEAHIPLEEFVYRE